MRYSVTQNSFLSGVIGRNAYGRNDLNQYSQALKSAVNVMILPQGSIMKRWGLKTFSKFDPPEVFMRHHGNYLQHNDVLDLGLLPFDFGDNNKYLIVVYVVTAPRNGFFFKIYKNGRTREVVRPFFYSPSDTMDDTWFSKLKGEDLRYSQFGDSLIICNNLFPPFSLKRKLNARLRESWEAERMDLKIPKYNFSLTEKEDAWSDERGWPRTCCFHQNRLFFGATKYLPQTLWGSKIGIYTDFDSSAATKDSDALEVTLMNNTLNEIRYIYSSRYLILFTSGGQWYNDNFPLTLRNFSHFKRQSEYSASNIQPAFLEDGIVFHQAGTSNIRLLRWDSALDNFISSSLTYFGGQLIKNPVSMVATKSLENLDGNFIFVMNADGSVALCNIDIYQQNLSWVIWKSKLKIKKAVAIGGSMFFHAQLKERVDNRYITHQFVVVLDPYSNFDLNHPYLARNRHTKIRIPSILKKYGYELKVGDAFLGYVPTTTTSSGLRSYGDENNRISVDHILAPGEFEPTGDHSWVRNVKPVQAGFKIEMEIEFLPIYLKDVGLNLSSYKHVHQLQLNLQNSIGHYVEYLDKIYTQHNYSSKLSNFGERKVANGFENYDLAATDNDFCIKIKHETPYAFKLLSICRTFSIYNQS